LPKTPFVAADLCLLAAAGYFAWQAHSAGQVWGWKEMALAGAFVAFGGWLATVPYIRAYEAEFKLLEQRDLTDATAGLNKLDQLARQITAATSQWQDIQSTATKTSVQATGLVDRMQAEAKGFAEAIQRANDAEKNTLKIEAEKLRRGEADFLQVLIHLLDHTFALHQAGVRSGQPDLARELGGFRAACLDTVRRVGIVAHAAEAGHLFNPQAHQTPDGTEPEPGAPISAMVACGYTYQGAVLRRIVVVTSGRTATTTEPSGDASEPAPTLAD
jgi:molecular chaperone GrpE (heat shock protein)